MQCKLAAAACGLLLLSSVSRSARSRCWPPVRSRRRRLRAVSAIRKSVDQQDFGHVGRHQRHRGRRGRRGVRSRHRRKSRGRHLHQGRQVRRWQQDRSGEVLGRRCGEGRRAQTRRQLRRRGEEGCARGKVGGLDRHERRLHAEAVRKDGHRGSGPRPRQRSRPLASRSHRPSETAKPRSAFSRSAS